MPVGMPKVEGSTHVILAALAGNLAVAATKLGAFALTRSSSMLTEGIHSLVDTANQLLLLVGQRRSARPPSPTHPFGYGMEAYFWSFVVALMIFLAGGAVSVWQGIERLRSPAPIDRPWLNFAVLAASAVFESLSFRESYREYRRIVGGDEIGLGSFLRLSKDPSLYGTLLEDGAALAGLAFAALGVAGASVFHLASADGAASVAIGALLIGIAVFLANETRSLIAGESAAPGIEQAIRSAAEAAESGLPVQDLTTLQMGPRVILVVVSVELPAEQSGQALRAAMDKISTACRRSEPRVRHVLFRPS
jgi:cation diffusion facilitator family transporter